jgi:acyl dehydratase
MGINLSLVGEKFKPVEHPYLWKDVVLYHLGIGAKAAELHYVYEGVKGGLKVIPTFAVVPALEAMATTLGKLGANPMMILHGEQGTYMDKPIPQRGKFITTPEVTGIYDKGKGALVVINTSTTDEKGEHLFDSMISLYCRGQGNFGGDRGPEQPAWDPPEGKDPEFKDSYKTSEDLPALYRLSGDINPLHIDPNFARIGGFDRPILHGLCTYGIVCKSLIKGLCNDDVTRLKEYKVRFSRPVMPGETITTKAWNLGDGTYAVQANTENNLVINQAYVKIEE